MSIDSSGLSPLRAISIPVARKDNTRPAPQSTEDKTPPKASSQLTLLRQGSETVYKQADEFRHTSEIKSSNGHKERIAIEAYESMTKEQQRQNIQLLLGVDTFV